jgi:hypothetical protein
MTKINTPPPLNWGNDEITQYIDNCRQNQYATFANKDSVAPLKRIDKCFRKVLDKPINPRPWFPFQFLHRSHSAFIAACGMAMAGQTVEVYALLRLSLESAAYGFYINEDTTRAELWLSRHDGATNKKKLRTEFQQKKIEDHITSVAPVLADIFKKLYDRTIDYGAHPNERGFSTNSKIIKDAEQTEFLQIYLQGDGLQLDLALKTTGQVGIWALSIFQLIYPEKWELLGIKHDLIELRKLF